LNSSLTYFLKAIKPEIVDSWVMGEGLTMMK